MPSPRTDARPSLDQVDPDAGPWSRLTIWDYFELFSPLYDDHGVWLNRGASWGETTQYRQRARPVRHIVVRGKHVGGPGNGRVWRRDS